MNIGDIFKKILGGAKGSDSFLGVDIGSSSIKVVQLKKSKGVAVLETYGELSLGPYAGVEAGRSTELSSDDISAALKNLMKEASVTTKKCGVSIPLKSSLVFMMDLPVVEKSRIADMVPIEARKYIPVPISEVFLDWKVVPKAEFSETTFVDSENEEKKEDEKSPKTEILAVAIHKDTVEKHKEIIKNAGLDLSFLEIEIFSTIRAVSGSNLLDFAVLDIGSGSSKLLIVEKGVMRDSHIIGRGSQDITLNISRSLGMSVSDAEEKKISIGVTGKDGTEKQISDIVFENMEYIFFEANKAILNYQKKHNKNVDKIIITGGGAVFKGVSDFAKNHFQIESQIADPFASVETPAFLDELLKQVGPGFSVALGIALRGLRESE